MERKQNAIVFIAHNCTVKMPKTNLSIKVFFFTLNVKEESVDDLILGLVALRMLRN